MLSFLPVVPRQKTKAKEKRVTLAKKADGTWRWESEDSAAANFDNPHDCLEHFLAFYDEEDE